jgi:ABC-type glycerol-3-phosphate transport system substrate-binding protein
MKHTSKRIFSLLLAVTMLLSLASMLAGCGGSNDDEDTFTIWMGSSVDSAYYTNYGENPVIQYLEKKFDINLEFIAPVAGNETDNFNTLVAERFKKKQTVAENTDKGEEEANND